MHYNIPFSVTIYLRYLRPTRRKPPTAQHPEYLYSVRLDEIETLKLRKL